MNPWPFDPAYAYWAMLLFLFFLTRELFGALFTPKRRDTFSEFIWWAFDTRREKALLAAFLASLTTHLVWEMTVVPVILFGIGVGWVIIQAFWRFGMAQKYSVVKGGLKLLETVVEILGAILLSAAPQVIGMLLNTAADMPLDQLHIPPEWATGWFLAIRFARNAWKNRSMGVMGQK